MSEQEIDHITPRLSEGHLVDFLHWLSDAAQLADDDAYYLDQWLEYADYANAEQDAKDAVKH